MAAKTTSASWLKEAPLLLTRIPKLLAPFTLFAVISILVPAVRHVYVNPLTAELSRRLGEMEVHTDPSSAEYARLQDETQHDARRLLVISIAVALVTLVLAFAKQIVARFFVGSSSTYSGSGDRYSLAELLRELTKWHNLKTSLVATAVVVAVLPFASMALLGGNFVPVIDSGMLSLPGSLFLGASQAFIYLSSLALMSVSVMAVIYLGFLAVMSIAMLQLASRAFLGLGGNFATLMREHWLLRSVPESLFLAAFLYMGILALRRVALKRKEWAALVLLTVLLQALLIPVGALAVLYLYTEEVMGLGLSLMSFYGVLQEVKHLLYLSAASVYCYCYLVKGMEECKEVASDGEKNSS